MPEEDCERFFSLFLGKTSAIREVNQAEAQFEHLEH